MPLTILSEVELDSSDVTDNEAPETKPAPKRVPPAGEAHEGEQFYACIVCNRQLRVGEARDDLVDGIFCRSFGNPSSGEHDFTRSHEIAEFGICAACWRGAADFGAVKFRSLVEQVWLFNVLYSDNRNNIMGSSSALTIGRCAGIPPLTDEQEASLLRSGYVGVYKTIRVTDGAELLNGGAWRLPSGQLINPH